MEITNTWLVDTMNRNISDGFVNSVIYKVKSTDDSTEIGEYTGEVSFTKPDSLPDDFIAYDKLNETTVINWVKNLLGTNAVKTIETNLENLNKTAYGKPF